MANKRIYDEVEGMTMNTVAVGGITSIQTEQGYVHAIDSQADGVDFPSDVDESGQKVTFGMQTTDVLQGVPLLLSTPGTATWFGHESGAATYGKGTLVNPVCHSLAFQSALGQYASIGVDGQCRFALAADTFDDVEKFDPAQTAPTLRHPGRLWQPRTCLHGAVAVGHVQSIGFSLRGRVVEDYDGGDKGTTAVDVAGFAAVGVTLVIRDSTGQAGPPAHDLATALLLAGVKDLTVMFDGVGDTPDKTLTLRNCKFRNRRKAAGRDWTGWTLTGVLQGRDPLTPFTIRTIDHATPAERLINFA